MDEDIIIVVAACNIILLATTVLFRDGRSFPTDPGTRYSIRNDIWDRVSQSDNCDGWFKRNLRYSEFCIPMCSSTVSD